MRVLFVTFLALLATAASAQDVPSADATTTLTGVVTNAETGEPVVGAGVVIPALGIGGVSQRAATNAASVAAGLDARADTQSIPIIVRATNDPPTITVARSDATS